MEYRVTADAYAPLASAINERMVYRWGRIFAADYSSGTLKLYF
jgi:hypothetical protein